MHAPAAAPRPGLGFVFLIGTLTALGAVSIDLYLPAIPTLAAHFGESTAAVQFTMSAFLAGMAIGQLGFGPLSDRVGRRPPLLAGIVIYTLASFAMAFSPGVEALTAGRFVQALGACSGAVVARAVVRDRYDTTESARLFSFTFLVLGIAPLLAPALGAVLLDVFGWRSIFHAMGVFGIAVGLALLFGLPESRTEATAAQAARETPWQSYKIALADRRVLGFALAGALNGGALFTYVATSSALFMGHFQQSAAAFGWIFPINAAGMIIASQINRAVLRHATPAQVASRASLASILISGLMVALSLAGLMSLPVAVVLIFLALGSYGFVGSNCMALALGAMPVRAGAISALIGAGAFSVGALTSALIAPFAAQGPLAIALGMATGFGGATLALYRIAGIGRWTA